MMANGYFTPEEIKMKRECRALRIVETIIAAIWTMSAIIGLAFFSGWLHEVGGATPLMTGVMIVIDFVGCAIILFVAIMISYPFHCKIERRHMELERRMNCIHVM